MKKKRELWNNEKILNRLQAIIDQIGYVPTNKELRANPQHKSVLAAMDKRGGKNIFLKELGYSVHQEKQGYWTKQKTIEELRAICEKLGYFPSHKEIKEIGGFTLSDKVLKYGGSKELSELLNYELKYKGKIDGWTLDEVKKTLIDIVSETGNFPNTTWLQNNGYAGMVVSIYSNFGNLEKIATELGFETETHTQGYWTDWANVKSEIEEIMKLTQVFPNYQQIKLLNRKLTKGIKEFGGINEVAKKMGYEPPKQILALDGHFVRSSFEFFVDNFLFGRGIPHSVDGYIDKSKSNYRYDFKIENKFIEVWGYSKNNTKISRQYNLVRKLKERFYKDNNLDVISFNPDDFKGTPEEIEAVINKRLLSSGIEFPVTVKNYNVENFFSFSGFWTPEETLNQLKEAISHYGDFPSERQLREDGNSSLAFAINKNGGVNHFRKILGYEIKKHNQHYWTEERILAKLKKIITEKGDFPSAQDLKEMNESRLSASIARKGGFKKFQKKLGFSAKHKRDGFYQNQDNILAECERIFLEIGHFPSARELLELNESTLRGAIGRHGGYAFYRDLLERKYNKKNK